MALPSRRLVLSLIAGLLLLLFIGVIVLLWQAPALTVRYLPGWLKQEYGLNLTLGKIQVNLQQPSLTLGPSALTDENGNPLLSLAELSLRPDLKASWHQKGLVLTEATLLAPKLALQRLAPDPKQPGTPRFNLTDALSQLLAPSPRAASEPPGSPPLFEIARLTLQQGSLTYRDSRPAQADGWLPPQTLSGLTLTLTNIRSLPDQNTLYTLAANLGKSPLKAEGSFNLSGASQGTLSLAKLPLKAFAPLWAPYLTLDLNKGQASARASYRLTPGKQGLDWQLSKGKLTLDGWQLTYPKGAEFARFTQLALSDINLDSRQQLLKIGTLNLQQPVLRAALDAQHNLDLSKVLAPRIAQTKPKPATTKGGKAAKPQSAPWRWQLGQIALHKGSLNLLESSSGKPLVRELTSLELTLSGLDNRLGKASPLTLKSSLNQQAQIAFEGKLTPMPFALEGEIKQQGLPLSWAQPYLQARARVKVQEGVLSSRLKLALATNDKGDLTKFDLGGGLDIDGLNVLSRADNQRLLQIARLELTGLHYEGLSQQVKIDDILLRQPFARIEINEDGTTNVQQLILPAPAAGEGSATTHAGPEPRLVIDQIRVQQGNLRFADRSLSQEFNADIADLNGQSRHITNIPNQRSDIAFNGKVDKYAPVTIRGGANLLIDEPELDLAVAFNNLEMTSFSPYSGTYAGYAIDKGQLTMKLNYRLVGNRLEGDNDIIIKKLQLGEKIASDKAKDLPLGLAVALLSDANGVIRLNLKVKGNLDQPDFSLGSIFWNVLGNTLRKAITSPFSLLASLAGGTKDLDELSFAPGEYELTQSQQSKLAKLAEALKARPQLSMNIRGKVNFNEERPLLQHQKLERVLARITGSPVDLTRLGQDEAMQTALAQAYQERFKEDVAALSDRLGLAVTSMALRDQAVILLRDQQLITAKSLRNLAMARARNTKSYLVETQAITPDRLFVLDSQVKETDKTARVVLTLDE
ncbi:DUF748 domain-containing protein [Aeromonas rivuli]|uniref:DUF748 domain-containing protein n=1 Tax=Aeromonas rivuli TaxID=648794 RepID=UPI0005A7EAC8|nr:DUF748 domain-containing protein [Aeromonas rivuli]